MMVLIQLLLILVALLVSVKDNYHLTQTVTVVMKDSLTILEIVLNYAQWNGINIMVNLASVLMTNHVDMNYVLMFGCLGIFILILVDVLITWPITQKAIVAQKVIQISSVMMVHVLKFAQVIGKHGILKLQVVDVLIVIKSITQKAIVAKNMLQII